MEHSVSLLQLPVPTGVLVASSAPGVGSAAVLIIIFIIVFIIIIIIIIIYPLR